MGTAHILNKRADLFLGQSGFAGGPEKDRERRDGHFIAGKVNGYLASGYCRRVEKVQSRGRIQSKKNRPFLQHCDIMRGRVYTPFEFAPIAWVGSKLFAALPEGERLSKSDGF
jgi:hypothetical protein